MLMAGTRSVMGVDAIGVTVNRVAELVRRMTGVSDTQLDPSLQT